MSAVLQPKPPSLADAVETNKASPPAPAGPPRDDWAAWVATEQQRTDDSKRELRTAILVALVVLTLGGAIYLSFVGAP